MSAFTDWAMADGRPDAEWVITRAEARELARVIEAAQVPGGVGHFNNGDIHWYDPQSSPKTNCVLCMALASLAGGKT